MQFLKMKALSGVEKDTTYKRYFEIGKRYICILEDDVYTVFDKEGFGWTLPVDSILGMFTVIEKGSMTWTKNN